MCGSIYKLAILLQTFINNITVASVFFVRYSIGVVSYSMPVKTLN